MCGAGQPPCGFAGTSDALAAVRAGLGYLAGVKAGSLPAGELAGCLRELAVAESVHTAARTSILAAFTAQSGCQDDGHGSARTWLAWQARISEAAAGAAVAWMRRFEHHPRVGAALTAGVISESHAREVCRLTRRLPADRWEDADEILLAAHAGRADLADLAGLVEEMLSRCAPPDTDDDRGFTDRSVHLDLHFRGAGVLRGDLTPECAATVQAGLAAMSKKAGPEDDRTPAQRRHDAVEEVFRRVIAAGDLPDVAGQPTRVVLHASLDQLRDLDGAGAAEAARAAGDGEPGWLSSRAAAEAYMCDAVIEPLVTGQVDPVALAIEIRSFLDDQQYQDQPGCLFSGCPGPDDTCPECASTGHARAEDLSASGAGPDCGPAPDAAPRACPHRAGRRRRPPRDASFIYDLLIQHAASVLSGPTGLAAALRTGLPGVPELLASGVSLPLDLGAPTRTIPPRLRRAVITRDRRCAFPGCRQRPAACQVHHLTPRSRGGPTALHNLALVCTFHHLIAIHRWGWTLRLNADGTTTAVSPDGTRTLHSHGPPAAVV
jgi:hypothetical protein